MARKLIDKTPWERVERHCKAQEEKTRIRKLIENNMTKTIEERARDYSHRIGCSDFYCAGLGKGYFDGATDQRKIDIDKACEVYQKELYEIIKLLSQFGANLYNIDKLGELISLDGCVKDFRKAMEEDL